MRVLPRTTDRNVGDTADKECLRYASADLQRFVRTWSPGPALVLNPVRFRICHLAMPGYAVVL